MAASSFVNFEKSMCTIFGQHNPNTPQVNEIVNNVKMRIEQFFRVSQEKQEVDFLALANSEFALIAGLTDPIHLNPEKIIEECIDHYFKHMKANFALYAIGGTSPFFVKGHLVLAHKDAWTEVQDFCESLVKSSKCVVEDQCSEMICLVKVVIDGLYEEFQRKNNSQQTHYIETTKQAIMEVFLTSVQTRYRSLFVKNDSGNKHAPPFYVHKEMSRFVRETVKKGTEKCDDIVTVLCASHENTEASDSFSTLKNTISEYGESLIVRNQENQKTTEIYIENQTSKTFNRCQKNTEDHIRKMPLGTEAGTVACKVELCKQKCFEMISRLCNEIGLDDLAISELKDNFDSKIDKLEEEFRKQCFKLLATCQKGAIDVTKNQATSEVPKWIKTVLPTSCSQKYTNIWKKHFLDACRKAEDECKIEIENDLAMQSKPAKYHPGQPGAFQQDTSIMSAPPTNNQPGPQSSVSVSVASSSTTTRVPGSVQKRAHQDRGNQQTNNDTGGSVEKGKKAKIRSVP